MNPITSPAAMMWINVASGVYATLEATGVIPSLLGSGQLGSIAAIALIALNGAAHAFSPPTPGPLAKP